MFRSVELSRDVSGSLFLHSMPGRNEAFSEFDRHLDIADIDLIVCLTPIEEIEKRSPEYANAIRRGLLGCDRLEYPIEDYNIPEDRHGFADFVSSVASHILEGRTVLIHCAGGIGRTGTLASCILQQLGMDKGKVSCLVEQAGSRPETSAQKALISWHADNQKGGSS